jgi:long-subunit acyl-CoA synthetase (AMP-forming)
MLIETKFLFYGINNRKISLWVAQYMVVGQDQKHLAAIIVPVHTATDY